ncbi:MAG: hypothetical protein COB02_01875 [Candidatus Cloacimonadota bacterium]|nr:MAG: hypothetical protein COB02_01875 [Candidatus Cloacimonadota bacterium]
MLQIVPQMKIYLAVEPIDFRCGIESLGGICKNVLKKDPFSGYLFLFTNKSKIGIKVLVYDEQGFWLCYKRFSKGKLKWWPSNKQYLSNDIELNSVELQNLLMNINPKKQRHETFREFKV